VVSELHEELWERREVKESVTEEKTDFKKELSDDIDLGGIGILMYILLSEASSVIEERLLSKVKFCFF
jgi:hypothetical protein